MTPEIRALQDELQERLAGRGVGDQSPEDCARDWVNLRRAYGHHVDRANAWDLPLMDPVPFRMRPTITLAEALQAAAGGARQAGEAFQAMVTTTPEPGLTVTDEVHITTDEQLATVAPLATGGPVAGVGPLLAGEIVVNIEPNLEAFHTKLAAELAQPAWRHPFLVTRDKIEQAFRELFR
jgi:hypothetical protein